jgi:hypothetical protein
MLKYNIMENIRLFFIKSTLLCLQTKDSLAVWPFERKRLYITVLNDINLSGSMSVSILLQQEIPSFEIELPSMSRGLIIGPQTVGRRGAYHEVRCF